MVKCLPTMWETWVQSLGWEDFLEKEMAVHSSILDGKSHGQRNLVGYSPWGCKELDTTEQLHFTFTSVKQPRKCASNTVIWELRRGATAEDIGKACPGKAP